MRMSFMIGGLSLLGLVLISGGSVLIDIGAVVLLTATCLSTIAYMVIHASKRSSIKFDPGLYYKVRNNSR